MSGYDSTGLPRTERTRLEISGFLTSHLQDLHRTLNAVRFGPQIGAVSPDGRERLGLAVESAIRSLEAAKRELVITVDQP